MGMTASGDRPMRSIVSSTKFNSMLMSAILLKRLAGRLNSPIVSVGWLNFGVRCRCNAPDISLATEIKFIASKCRRCIEDVTHFGAEDFFECSRRLDNNCRSFATEQIEMPCGNRWG